MKDIINIAVVNFKTTWGVKEANRNKILGYCEEAGKRGADLIVFPETALTGYDNEPDKVRAEKMQVQLAETIPGESTEIIAKIAQKYHMYIVFGMPEKDREAPDIIYNSAAVIYPNGKTESYRKIHLPFDEVDWAIRGETPVLIDTEWGPIGITICYDTYCFPEIIRYYRSMGARLCLNVTACPDLPCTAGSAELTIPTYAYSNYMYIASANLCGVDKTSNFIGGSSVIGPDISGKKAHVYLGKMFNSAGSDEPGMIMGTIDLALTEQIPHIPIYQYNEKIGDRDWRPELYSKWFMNSKKIFEQSRLSH